jgi:two-component system cell cycle response regulator
LRKKILAVDDDEGGLEAIRQMLLQRGYDVATAASGEEALSLVAAESFDLAILDVVLPGISGYDVCRRIRDDPRTRGIPVIFLTGKGGPVDVEEAQKAGSDLLVVKPVLATRLLNMVSLFLAEGAPLARPRPPAGDED